MAMTTNTTPLARWIEPIRFDEILTIGLQLVIQTSVQIANAYIKNRSSQFVVFYHTLDMQIFNHVRSYLVIVSQRMTDLMNII